MLREFAEEYPLGIEMGRFLAASCGKYYTQVRILIDRRCQLCDSGWRNPPSELLRAEDGYAGATD